MEALPPVLDTSFWILNWMVGERSKSKKAGVSLIKVNKAAVGKKHITAKSLNKFLRENYNDPALQRRKVVGRKKDRRLVRNDDKVCGKNRAVSDEKIDSILFPGAGSQHENHYVDMSGQVKKGRLPEPKQTKSSNMQKMYTRKNAGGKNKSLADPWKMKKFSNIKSRYQHYKSKESESKSEEKVEEESKVEASAPEAPEIEVPEEKS